NQYSHPNIKQNQSTSFNQYEYQSLYNLGLKIVEQNGFLIVTGDDIYSKKDSIKACGFRFDSKSKSWYKAIENVA
ncbi:DNA repair protein Rad52, partial [Aliarcobacter butzleri]